MAERAVNAEMSDQIHLAIRFRSAHFARRFMTEKNTPAERLLSGLRSSHRLLVAICLIVGVYAAGNLEIKPLDRAIEELRWVQNQSDWRSYFGEMNTDFWGVPEQRPHRVYLQPRNWPGGVLPKFEIKPPQIVVWREPQTLEELVGGGTAGWRLFLNPDAIAGALAGQAREPIYGIEGLYLCQHGHGWPQRTPEGVFVADLRGAPEFEQLLSGTERASSEEILDFLHEAVSPCNVGLRVRTPSNTSQVVFSAEKTRELWQAESATMIDRAFTSYSFPALDALLHGHPHLGPLTFGEAYARVVDQRGRLAARNQFSDIDLRIFGLSGRLDLAPTAILALLIYCAAFTRRLEAVTASNPNDELSGGWVGILAGWEAVVVNWLSFLVLPTTVVLLSISPLSTNPMRNLVPNLLLLVLTLVFGMVNIARVHRARRSVRLGMMDKKSARPDETVATEPATEGVESKGA